MLPGKNPKFVKKNRFITKKKFLLKLSRGSGFYKLYESNKTLFNNKIIQEILFINIAAQILRKFVIV